MEIAMAPELEGTLEQQLLGGRKKVADSLATSLSEGQEKYRTEFDVMTQSLGIDDPNELIHRLENNGKLKRSEVMPLIRLLPYIGGQGLDDLPVDKQMLANQDVIGILFDHMVEKKFRPLQKVEEPGQTSADDKKAQIFNPGACVGVFVRLQAIEDLCI